jgi:hypothetical protein
VIIEPDRLADRLQEEWVNPLVCVCPKPECDRLGMCQSCKRKPLALMAPKR